MWFVRIVAENENPNVQPHFDFKLYTHSNTCKHHSTQSNKLSIRGTYCASSVVYPKIFIQHDPDCTLFADSYSSPFGISSYSMKAFESSLYFIGESVPFSSVD